MTTPKEAWDAAIKQCAEFCEMFADENFRMATDTILLDPLLSAGRTGRPYVPTPENEALVEQMRVSGVVHSCSAHAAQKIAAAIREMKWQET